MLAALCAAALAGCAVAPRTEVAAPVTPGPDTGFEVSGRLSVRRGSDAVAANFRWTHERYGDELIFATPLGQTLARLEGREGRVRLEAAEGRVREASDWEALTAEALGAPIPVRGLAWWIRGVPHPNGAHSIERDASGRVSVLRQDGWEIVYDFTDARPSRLRLIYPDVEIRLVIDRWGAP